MGVTRIQHNLSAMNAMSNYQGNQKTLTGNLEKLSSGYRINSAADDAAGLAISEKMRSRSQVWKRHRTTLTTVFHSFRPLKALSQK
jgi:hypothetical protein